MNRRRIYGLVVTLIGAGAIFFCLYVMQRLDLIRARVASTSSSFGNNPFASIAKGVANDKISQYDALVIGGLIIGSLLMVVGLWILFFGKKKNR